MFASVPCTELFRQRTVEKIDGTQGKQQKGQGNEKWKGDSKWHRSEITGWMDEVCACLMGVSDVLLLSVAHRDAQRVQRYR